MGHGARSKEQGAWGIRQLADRWSMEHGAWSKEQGARSMGHGARSKEHGAWSRRLAVGHKVL